MSVRGWVLNGLVQGFGFLLVPNHVFSSKIIVDLFLYSRSIINCKFNQGVISVEVFGFFVVVSTIHWSHV